MLTDTHKFTRIYFYTNEFIKSGHIIIFYLSYLNLCLFIFTKYLNKIYIQFEITITS